MFECPGCGGDLKFDIASQQMMCAYCNSTYDPYEVKDENEVESSDEFGVTVFTCPQCGGEIYSTDNSAAGFCSFCGASNVLGTRMKNEKKPDYIIPFKKTKEDCKKEYTKMMKKAIFAPKELRSEKHIEGFRGIYMPYWVYYVTQKGYASLKGSTSSRSGDYIITRHYSIGMELDNYYKGLSFDASSSFADNISEKIAPFDVKNMTAFAPSFLSGFYADISDIEGHIYNEDAIQVANRKTKKHLNQTTSLKKYTVETKDYELTDKFHTKVKDTNSAMFPVWFMSYRNKDRVAYATVNGQTGKVVADLPVDIKKYLLGSVVLAVPIMILLNLFLTLIPTTLLSLVCIFATLALILYSIELKQIVVRENYRDDKGMMEAEKNRERKKNKAMSEAAASLDGFDEEPFVMTKDEIKKKTKKNIFEKTDISTLITILVFLGFFAAGNVGVFATVLGATGYGIIIGICLLVIMAMCLSCKKKAKEAEGKAGIGIWLVLLSVGLSMIIALFKPVSDLYYYVSGLLVMASVLLVLLNLIKKYNILATRRLPQFDYEGGDNNA